MTDGDSEDVFFVIRENPDGNEDWMGGIEASPGVHVQMAFGSPKEAEQFRAHLARRDGIPMDELTVVRFQRVLE
jgi:hypothetical protein